jgi:hypothetical protein
MLHSGFGLLLWGLVGTITTGGATIPQGSHVLLRMMNSVTTRTAQEGDYVYLQTASPVAIAGHIVVPAHSYVQGVVSHARRGGRVKGTAELGIRLETLTFPDGRSFHFSPRLHSVDSNGSEQKVDRQEGIVKQGTERDRDAARIAVFAGSGAAVGGLTDRSWQGAGIGAGAGGVVGLATVMMTRGREVQLRAGSTLDVVFDRAVALE